MPKRKNAVYLKLKHQVVWLISTAFAIAAALFWKDTIMEIIKYYFPPAESIYYSVFASTVMTAIAIFVVWVAHEIFKE